MSVEFVLRNEDFYAARQAPAAGMTRLGHGDEGKDMLRTKGIPPGKSLAWAGPPLLTESLAGERDVKLYGPREFYPYSRKEMDRKGEQFPGAFAAHHWAYSWAQP
jgi:hypothetical protein